MAEASTVLMTLSRGAFRALLQRGVGISDGAGASVREFLLETLGIDGTYVEEKLQTVFLNGQPVDDFDRARVRPGAVLALSGAMPGLAGATMRRGGYYARLREGITYSGEEGVEEDDEAGIVIVKLFNRPLADLTETLAARPLLLLTDALDAPGGWGAPDARGTDGDWVRVQVTLT